MQSPVDSSAPCWRNKKLELVETTQAPMRPVWIISFENGDEANQAKRVIYNYLDDHGEYIGANHTRKRYRRGDREHLRFSLDVSR